MVTEVVAERRMYLPLAALTLYAVILGRAALSRVPASSRTRLALVAAITAGLVGGLAARTLARVADYATPETIWQAAFALDPTNPQATLSLAIAKYATGEPSEARKLAQPVTQWRREHSGARDWSARAHLLLGAWEEKEGDLPAALAQYSAVEQASPDRGVALLEAARVLLRLNQPHAAAERLQAAIDLGSTGASEHHNLGVALSLTGQHAAAAEHFDRAYALDPNKPDSAEALALALQALGRPAAAATILEEVIRRWPDNARAHARLGQALIILDQSESALKALDRALALDTTRAETQLARCDAMARLGKVAQALHACDQAISMAPTDARLRGERDRIVARMAQQR
jgi:tetratricopeptide (TPR) repeat protein